MPLPAPPAGKNGADADSLGEPGRERRVSDVIGVDRKSVPQVSNDDTTHAADRPTLPLTSSFRRGILTPKI